MPYLFYWIPVICMISVSCSGANSYSVTPLNKLEWWCDHSGDIFRPSYLKDSTIRMIFELSRSNRPYLFYSLWSKTIQPAVVRNCNNRDWVGKCLQIQIILFWWHSQSPCHEFQQWNLIPISAGGALSQKRFCRTLFPWYFRSRSLTSGNLFCRFSCALGTT